MRTNLAAKVAACLVLIFGLGGAVAQTPPAPQPAPEMLEEVAGINRSLARLVDMLETIRDNQKVDLLLKRIELKERRLAPLETRLRDAESRCEGIQREIDDMETMRAQIEEEIAEEVRSGRDEMTRDSQLMLREFGVRVEYLEASLERATTQKREHEDDLALQRKEIAILDEMLEEFLE